MHRINTPNASQTLPSPEAPGPNPIGFYTAGTIFTHDWLNAAQEELCYVIEQSAIVLSTISQNQLLLAINNMILGGASGSGIPAVSYDKNPTLGGDLELNDHIIKSTTGDLEFLSPGTLGGAAGFATLVHTRVAHIGDLDNQILFGSGTISVVTGGETRLDVSNAGLRLGAGSRVDTILNEDDMASNSATALTTQRAYKKYADDSAAEADEGQVLMFSFEAQKDFSNIGTIIIPKSGTIKNLYLRLYNIFNEADITEAELRLYVNGVETLLKIDISGNYDAASYYEFSNTDDIVGILARDEVELKISFESTSNPRFLCVASILLGGQ